MNIEIVRQLLAEERFHEAYTTCAALCDASPDNAEAWYLHGAIGGQLGDYAVSEQSTRRALALRESPDAHRNLAIALQRQGRETEALQHLRRSMELDSSPATDWLNLGMQQQARELPGDAIASYSQALSIQPDLAEAGLLRAICLLQTGDYANGWAEYEWRWRWRGRTRRSMPVPEWAGEPLAGRTILLHPEQGFGDAIQFVRFAPRVRAIGARVILETHPALARLFRSCAGIDQLLAGDMPSPRFDFHAPLMSMPRLLGIGLDGLSDGLAYIPTPTGDQAKFAPRLAEAGGALRVGLVWAGGPAAKNDHLRSCPWQHMQALGDVPGVHYFSLQMGPAAADTARLRAAGLALSDLAGLIGDFADTATAMSALDLVITVDTATAHLAGALGRPVWVLLPTNPDWRWLLGRDDSPWYPTARLFRQQQSGDWTQPLARVVSALGHLKAGKQ